MIHQSCRASPGGSQGLAAELDAAVGVGERAGLLGEGRRGQDHVGVDRPSRSGRSPGRPGAPARPAPRGRGWTSGSDIAGFSPMMYIPLIVPRWIASMISTTVSPGSGSSASPQSVFEERRGRRRPPRGDSRGRPSGSGPRRTPPARCSARGAGAAPPRAGRPARRAAPGRSGSGRCRCRGRAARSPSPRRSSPPGPWHRAGPPRGASPASIPQIGAIASGENAADPRAEVLEALGEPLDVIPVVQLLVDDRRGSGRSAAPRRSPAGTRSMWVACRLSAWPRGSIDDQLAPRASRRS